MTLTSEPASKSLDGVAQLATAIVLITFISFTSGWRLWFTLELAAYFLASGVVMIVYANSSRRLPLKALAETWLPILPLQLVAFVVLFGVGVAFAEESSTIVGVVLIAIGYAALAARSVMRLARASDSTK